MKKEEVTLEQFIENVKRREDRMEQFNWDVGGYLIIGTVSLTIIMVIVALFRDFTLIGTMFGSIVGVILLGYIVQKAFHKFSK